jgi:hypothetical protein
VRFLADLRPTALGCGHGEPIIGREAAAGLEELARDFPAPRHGRYAAEPARTDENGITYLPPPVPDPLPKMAAAAGVSALAAGAAVLLARRYVSRD